MPQKESSAKKSRIIKLDHITKIEGHAKINIKIEKNQVKKVKLDVYESARFFESLVLCRKYDELSPLTSRICGTCSPSHAITSLLATENALKVKVSEQTDVLRDLLLYGTAIQNHVMHLYLLALPDYFGYESAIAMASKHKDKVLMGLNLKKIGNQLVTAVGGREVHPITAVVGGFSKIPDNNKLKEQINIFKKARKHAVSTVELFMKLKYPKFSRDTQAFGLVNDTHSFYKGRINCIGGICFPDLNGNSNYDNIFAEHIKKGSTAKVVLYKGKPFFNGALARLKVNSDSLSKGSKKYIDKIDFMNPFHNNTAQAIEVLHSFDRIIEILENIKLKQEDVVDFKVGAGSGNSGIRGVAVTEAPRGLVLHDYTLDKDGYCIKANIITPTAQNLKQMEDDLKIMIPTLLNKPESVLKKNVEMLIRAYDPCFSCSSHFLELNIEKD
ncbi:MAG: Ni/Fe hydrogenase subunit alpha [Candidatus Woesearchaeota archaeon]